MDARRLDTRLGRESMDEMARLSEQIVDPAHLVNRGTLLPR
jgi:hypothetical protein